MLAITFCALSPFFAGSRMIISFLFKSVVKGKARVTICRCKCLLCVVALEFKNVRPQQILTEYS